MGFFLISSPSGIKLKFLALVLEASYAVINYIGTEFHEIALNGWFLRVITMVLPLNVLY